MNIPLRTAVIGGLAVLAAVTAGGFALAAEDRPPTAASGSVGESITPVQNSDREDCPGEAAGADQGEGADGAPVAGL